MSYSTKDIVFEDKTHCVLKTEKNYEIYEKGCTCMTRKGKVSLNLDWEPVLKLVKGSRLKMTESTSQNRPRVFICSPFTANTQEGIDKNAQAARDYARYAVLQGYAPFVPHLLYPQFLDEFSETERELGLVCGFSFMDTCEELWAFVPETGLSKGMLAEIKYARSKGITVKEIIWDNVKAKVRKEENGHESD